MTDPFLNYIDSSVKEVLDSPGYLALSGDERDKLVKSLSEHFENMILETFMNRLTDNQVKEIRDTLSNHGILEEKFAEYAAQIPGLAGDIEDRLERETEALKSLAHS